jgi:hypothetical protein
VGRNLRAFTYLRNKVELGGIDPSDLALHQAKKLKINVFKGLSKDLTKEMLLNYNLIILAHVLEHFINPLEELLYLTKIVSPGTFFYIEVPDSENPYVKVGLISWFKIHHTYYFTKQALDLIFNRCNLSVIKFKRSNNSILVLLKKHRDLPKFQIENVMDNMGQNQLWMYKKIILKSIFYIIFDLKERIQKILYQVI